MNKFSDFVTWESASLDTIDFKKIYVDIADGDLISGLLLSELVYYYLPCKNHPEQNKLRVSHEGFMWIAVRYKDWWERARITKKQAERAIKILGELGIIIKIVKKFSGVPTVHLRINERVFLERLQDEINQRAMKTCSSVEYGSDKTIDGIDKCIENKWFFIPTETENNEKEKEITAEGKWISPTGKIENTERGQSLTKNTTKTTSKIIAHARVGDSNSKNQPTNTEQQQAAEIPKNNGSKPLTGLPEKTAPLAQEKGAAQIGPDIPINQNPDTWETTDYSWMRQYYRPLAQEFFKQAGMTYYPYTESERKLWYRELNVWYKAGITEENIREAIQEMRRKRLTIRGPQSVTGMAKDHKARQETGSGQDMVVDVTGIGSM